MLMPVSACTPSPESTGVIPQQQLDALEKAKRVEGMLQDALEKQNEKIEQ
jgi:hypothetical protein